MIDKREYEAKVICAKLGECKVACSHKYKHLHDGSCELTSCTEYPNRGICILYKEMRGAVYDR